MTPHVHAKEIHAFAEGYEIEVEVSENWWQTTDHPQWDVCLKYRIKDPYRELKEAAEDPTKQIRLLDRDGKGRHSPYESAGYVWTWLFPPEHYEIRDKPTPKVKMLAYFTGVNLIWIIEYGVTSTGWKRVPTEDKEIEVEEE
jgi:hypothetical protein